MTSTKDQWYIDSYLKLLPKSEVFRGLLGGKMQDAATVAIGKIYERERQVILSWWGGDIAIAEVIEAITDEDERKEFAALGFDWRVRYQQGLDVFVTFLYDEEQFELADQWLDRLFEKATDRALADFENRADVDLFVQDGRSTQWSSMITSFTVSGVSQEKMAQNRVEVFKWVQEVLVPMLKSLPLNGLKAHSVEHDTPQ